MDITRSWKDVTRDWKDVTRVWKDGTWDRNYVMRD